MHAERKAAEKIFEDTLYIFEMLGRLEFKAASEKISELKVYVESCNSLDDANLLIVSKHDMPYSPRRCSDYLNISETDRVKEKIAEVLPSLRCAHNWQNCSCRVSEDSIAQVKGMRCYFCDDTIAIGDKIMWVEKLKQKLCKDCDQILFRKVHPTRSIGFGVRDLLQDARKEAGEPYFQFQEAKKFVERAEELLLSNLANLVAKQKVAFVCKQNFIE